jgi:hypothetical protein
MVCYHNYTTPANERGAHPVGRLGPPRRAAARPPRGPAAAAGGRVTTYTSSARPMPSLLLMMVAATAGISGGGQQEGVRPASGYLALSTGCRGGPSMAILNSTSLAGCKSQCTSQRDGFNGCVAALEKLCGSVFRACPAFPCEACEACTTDHQAALSSAGCDVAEAGCVAPGCTGVLTQYCVKPPAKARPPAHAAVAPACMGVSTELGATRSALDQKACHLYSSCQGVVDPAGKCRAAAKGLCGYRSTAPPPPSPPTADPFARCGPNNVLTHRPPNL